MSNDIRKLLETIDKIMESNLNEVKVNRDSYDSVLNDPDILFGFEIEIETDLVQPSYVRDTFDVNSSSWNEVRHLFKRKARMEKTFSEHGANGSIDDFIRTKYGSNSAACRALDIIPEHGWAEDESRVYAEADPYASDKSHLETIANELSNYLRVPVDHEGATATSDTWAITTDPSLPRGGAEIISPPYQLSKGLAYLEKTFRYLNAKGYRTTERTGLHINLSIRGKSINDYDFMKMIFLFEERRAAELFDRIKSTYSKQMQPMLDSILKLHGDADLSNRNTRFLLSKLKDIGSDETFFKKQFNKHYSINNRGNGVFEFRNMGGEQYHRKFDDIKNQTVQMANILLVGSNENLYAKEYITKFQKTISNNNSENQYVLPNLETFSKFFAANSDAKSWVKMLMDGKPVADNIKMRLALLMYNWGMSQSSKMTMPQLSYFFKKIGITKEFIEANNKGYKRKNVAADDTNGSAPRP